VPVAVGYLVKNADPAELELAIRAVARGKRFLERSGVRARDRRCLGRVDKEQSSLDRLTLRQREVLQLIAEGHTTKQIAAKLNISPRRRSLRGELMKVSKSTTSRVSPATRSARAWCPRQLKPGRRCRRRCLRVLPGLFPCSILGFPSSQRRVDHRD